MSVSSRPNLLQRPTTLQLKSENQISLLDRTRSQQENGERQGSEASEISETLPQGAGLRKRLTNQSNNLQETLRREINRQKYARFRQERYHVDDDERSEPSEAAQDTARSASQTADESALGQRGYFGRAQDRAKTILIRKRLLGQAKDQRDTVVDVLYENQRGAFLFGIPKYSSSSLLPTDPKPWQNGDFRTSPCDIRNAQVPDPSWEWVWKSWYVDMSHDVDEEGWEYSFAFVGHGGRAFAWHGNHPWFHSFVRRRRWLRLRKRRHFVHQTREKAHELSADYFTIHTKALRPASLSDSRAPSSNTANILARLTEPEMTVGEMEITNIADLFLALRRATLDREKITAVQKFLDQGDEELVYLSERMEEIMEMFVFQSARRQLLRFLTEKHDDVHAQQDKLAEHEHDADDDATQNRHQQHSRRTEYLLKAVHAAEKHVDRLEYWSDRKNVSECIRPLEDEGGYVQPSFKNKQSASDGVKPLHAHREHDPPQRGLESRQGELEVEDPRDIPTPPKDETPQDETLAPLTRKKTEYFDAASSSSSAGGDEMPAEVFTPAAETATEIEGKGDRWEVKGNVDDFALDGQAEDKPAPKTHGHSTIVAGDKLEERVPESFEE